MVVASPKQLEQESVRNGNHKVVAIIDDDLELAKDTRYQLEEAGYQSKIFSGKYEDVNLLAQEIHNTVYAAVCDHRLSDGALANFFGSELVAHLYDLKTPAILISQYRNDSHSTIGEHRRKIPVFLTRDEANPVTLKNGIDYCSAEINGKISRERKPRRTLIRVEQVGQEFGQEVVEAFVIGWKQKQAVRFPASVIPPSIRKNLRRGTRLFAHVNTGATKADDLFFERFELAPEPNNDDGLA
jgi:FixJ family two-component response regulator